MGADRAAHPAGQAGRFVDWAQRVFGRVVEIVKRSDAARGFVVPPKRRIVERTFLAGQVPAAEQGLRDADRKRRGEGPDREDQPDAPPAEAGLIRLLEHVLTCFMPRPLRYLWAFPTTCLGLLFVPPALLGRGRALIVRGVIEVHGGPAAWFLKRCVPLPGGAAAMTLGHVVLGRDAPSLDRSRDHERAHVRQCERWGPFFLPAYLLAAAYAHFPAPDPYLDNPFEREAYGKNDE